jgi:hypothetical protein
VVVAVSVAGTHLLRAVQRHVRGIAVQHQFGQRLRVARFCRRLKVGAEAKAASLPTAVCISRSSPSAL